MRLLRLRPLRETREVIACVRQALPLLETGLRPLDGLVAGGDAADVAAIDAGGRLVLIVCEVEAEPAAILRVLESAAWCAEHGGLAARLDPALDAGAPPRVMLIAARFGERTLRLLRTLGPTAPVALECRVFDDGADTLVSFEPAPPAIEAARTPSPSPGAAPAGSGGKTGGAGVAAGRAPAGAPLTEAGIGRLKFTEAFR